MKKTRLFAIIILCLLSLTNVSKAQNNFTIPNGSFENWQTGQGYGVSVLFFQLPVYSDYTYPSDWNYLTYPVNENLSYMGFNVNINTSVPLLKATQETGTVPDGNAALKIETFMMSDLIDPLVYSLAESAIDSEYTSLVAPTILSTAELNLDSILPMVTTVLSNLDNNDQLFAMLAEADVNHYFTGGIPLNGVVPSELIGHYKYTSAIADDNGGIFYFGTKYNSITHRREVVGGGYSFDFTDASDYTPFSIEYMKLYDYNPAQFANVDPDSLIIMLVSSANNNRQQGSAFYLDNLQLLTTSPIVEPDTCLGVTNLTVQTADTTHATISWNNIENPTEWQYTFDVEGFTPDNGTLFTATDSTVNLTDLTPGTDYEFYVRSVCDNGLTSEWAMVSFHTEELPPIDTTGVENYNANHIQVYPNPAQGTCFVVSQNEIPSSIHLFSADGKLLQAIRPSNVETKVALPNGGIFFLQIKTSQGTTLQKVLNQ
ncbi:MAG: T9SS type A sorting domain-containing protein [Bacteroidales bacterium]|nr:T9SS type A sorting domain-containing protein [Bacteroidales bacterium]